MVKEKDNVTVDNFDEQEYQTIILTNQDGEEVEFEVLDYFDHEGEEYAILLPADQSEEEEGEVVILKIVVDEKDEDEAHLEAIDDIKLLEELFEIFVDRMESQVE